jgi:hypothetical protein
MRESRDHIAAGVGAAGRQLRRGPTPRAGHSPHRCQAQRRRTSARPPRRRRPVPQRRLPDDPAIRAPAAAPGTATRTGRRQPGRRPGSGRHSPPHGARCRSGVAGYSRHREPEHSPVEYAPANSQQPVYSWRGGGLAMSTQTGRGCDGPPELERGAVGWRLLGVSPRRCRSGRGRSR